MERQTPIPGSFYRHFKGNIYQIREIAIHTETGERMVVYQAMYPPFGTWVRPLSMFMEKVDRQKYPQATQDYRFEEIAVEKTTEKSALNERKRAVDVSLSEEEVKQIIMDGQAEKKLSGIMTGEEIAQKGFMALLDAQTFREKRRLFVGMKEYMDDRILSNIAVALDIVLEEGSSQEHYEAILYCIEKFEQFEGGRLRR